MKTFTDNGGRTWSVALNVDALKRVRALCSVDLLEVVGDGGTLLNRLSDDPILLCDVLYAVCKPEVDIQKVSDADFGRAMAGDAIAHAADALLEELTDFFHGPKRAVFRSVLEKTRRYMDLAGKLALARLDDPALNQRIEQAVEEAFRPASVGESSGVAPASSG